MASITSELFRYELTRTEPVRKEIGEERAAVLLGLRPAQLRKLCEQYRLGHGALGGTDEQTRFTYEDLYRLCRWVAGPSASC